MPFRTYLHARPGGRGGPLIAGLGHLEVMHIVSVTPAARWKHRQVRAKGHGEVRLQLRGWPASPVSVVQRAEILFLMEHPLPPPSLDTGQRMMRLYYPMEDLDEVLDVLAVRGSRMCYLWRPVDRSGALSMLVASH